MPSDLSSPRLGERAFKTLDDVNNLGLHKIMIGEVDVFQISSADELYGHMNINYLRLPELPSFDHYDRILNAIEKGDGFIPPARSFFRLPQCPRRVTGVSASKQEYRRHFLCESLKWCGATV